ncbi:hypothetical protein ES707_01256 [subsurface metagenome]
MSVFFTIDQAFEFLINYARRKFHPIEKMRKSKEIGQVWYYNHFHPVTFPKIEVLHT